MKIKDLLSSYKEGIFHNLSEEILNKNLTNIVDSSSQVSEGSIFVAIVGEKFNGVNFLEETLKKGAILAVLPYNYKDSIKEKNVVFVKNTRDFFARSNFLLHKLDIPTNILTVSGTNGKSSTSFFISQFLKQLNIKSMVIGTLGIYIDGKKDQDCLTTPSATTLIQYFKIAKNQQIDYVIMESSSHGIEQHRVDGINFKVAGFTNLTQDHLDYHKTMENYFLSKSRLYTSDLSNTSVINVDDAWGVKLASLAKDNKKKVLEYGFFAKNGLKILEIKKADTSQIVKIEYENKAYEFTINVMGEFQVYNILCAMGILLMQNFKIADLIKATNKLTQVEGRLNLILPKNKSKAIGKIFVDFAHSPNALEEVLKNLKKEKHNKLKVLFGCGGDRDKTKRPIMGQIAANYADVIYITDDNPRTENAKNIREEIEQGITKKDNLIVYNIDGRYNAILKAVKELQENDILLVAGKGHENYQIIGNEKFHFSDKEVILEVLEKNETH